MAEYTANTVQTVNSNQNVIFTDAVICGNKSIVHRDDSGIISLRGITSCQCRARFRIYFNGNIAIPSTGTVAPISLAIAINGEPVASAVMTSTSSATATFNNVSSSIFVDVPAGCCTPISIINTTSQAISVRNANLLVERVA
jgi:hypothetical protein